MSKHTKGPWEIVKVAGVPMGIGTRRNAAGKETSVFKMIGNTIDKSDGPKDMAEIVANARLIAAAPDLLAACKESLVILPRAMDSDLDFDAKTKAEYIARYPLIVQLKAAISKAESP